VLPLIWQFSRSSWSPSYHFFLTARNRQNVFSSVKGRGLTGGGHKGTILTPNFVLQATRGDFVFRQLYFNWKIYLQYSKETFRSSTFCLLILNETFQWSTSDLVRNVLQTGKKMFVIVRLLGSQNGGNSLDSFNNILCPSKRSVTDLWEDLTNLWCKMITFNSQVKDNEIGEFKRKKSS